MSGDAGRGDAGASLDREAFEPGFGSGGVPWYLMLLYLAFLVFFTWYALEYQLTDYLELEAETASEAPTDAASGGARAEPAGPAQPGGAR